VLCLYQRKKIPASFDGFSGTSFKNVKQKMEASPNDYLRVNIDNPSLDSFVWVEFTQSKNLDEDKILTKIEAAQQSKMEFLLTDGGTQLDFFHVKYPEGSGGAKMKHTWIKKNLKRRSNPSSRLTTAEILCACLVPLLSPVFMPRNLKFPTLGGRRNG
jgi:hypothetical protein